MKNSLFPISLILILSSSTLRFSNENFPFLKEKYLFWFVLLTLVSFVFAIKNNCKKLKINRFDAVIISLTVFGAVHFLLFSKATIYNNQIWNYMGYLALYMLLRHQCATSKITTKTLTILLYFCSGTAVINIFLMLLQWNHWIAAPNEFFLTTGMFFSPNQLGIYLSIGFLSTFFLWKKGTVLWMKITLGLSGLLIFSGLCITESRGAFISLILAIGYYLFVSKIKTKSFFNWKIYLGTAVLLVSSFYFITIVSKNKTDSTSGRFFTTQQILKQITQNPLGYGLNSFAEEYNKGKAAYFEKNTDWEEMKNAGYIYHANNDFLQLTFELGILWILIFSVFIALLFREKAVSVETQIARTLLVCLLVFSLTNTIIITPIFILIGCVCSVVIINSTAPKVIYEFENNVPHRFIGIGLSLFFVFVLITRINAEYKLFSLYENKMYLKGENQLQGYVSKIDNTGEELFMGGLTLIREGYVDDGFRYLEMGFERSGRPSFGRILAKGLQQQKQYIQAEEIYNYNKNAEPYRYQARMDLLDLFIESKQQAKAKKIAEQIIKLPVKIPSATIEKYKSKAKSYLDGVEPKKTQKLH